MKGFLVVLNIIFLHTNADALQSLEENLGSVNFHVGIGNLPLKYAPMDNNDVIATKAALRLAEWLRPYFETGIGPVPPLDPLQLKNLGPLQIGSNSLISGAVNLRNFHMTGAKEFTVNYGELRIESLRMDFGVSVPLISAEIDFDADVYFGFVPLSFGGHLRVNLLGLDLNGSLGANPTLVNGRNVFQIDSVDIHANAQNIQVQVSQLHFGDDDLTDEQLSVATWFDNLKDVIAQNVAQTALKEINRVLLKFPVDSTLKYLLGQ